MRLRRIPKALPTMLEHPELVLIEPTEFVDFKKVFQNENPLHIEIGCGKGQFVMGMAKANPKINFIAIEKFDSVLYKALLRLLDDPLPNVRLMLLDAERLTEVFQKVNTIYLNFSDPWPKPKHEKRRLTFHTKLKLYKELLDGPLVLKTDNLDFFNYSLESFEEFGATVTNVTNDLHQENIFNVPTEFEERFSKLGHKINRCVVEFK